MNNEIKLKLVDLVEKHVIASLVAHNYVSMAGKGKKLVWDNVIINDHTLELINIKEEHEDVEIAKALLEIFPKEAKAGSSLNAIITRIKQWRSKCNLENITYKEIIEAAENHCQGKEVKYIGTLMNFIYKYDAGAYTSRLEKEVDLLRQNYDAIKSSNYVVVDSAVDLSQYGL